MNRLVESPVAARTRRHSVRVEVLKTRAAASSAIATSEMMGDDRLGDSTLLLAVRRIRR
jgi:hypothetical protein